MRSAALLVLALLALAASPSLSPAHAEDAGDVWSDHERLEKHLAAACEAVEETCGFAFGRRPAVRVSSQAEVELILAGQVRADQGMLESAPQEERLFIAYYDPSGHRVHILPEAVRRVARLVDNPALLDEDVLRVVLVHEATHALDFQRFPVRWTLACCTATDERLATEAVLEGHAQLVTEEVSRAWGIEVAFQHLTRLYTGAADGDLEGGAFDPEAAFTYLQGHAFMRAVLTAEGPEGVARVLRDPPFETRIIDRPLLHLQPELRALEVDLQALLEVFRPLVQTRTWVPSKWRVLGPPPTAARTEGAGFLGEYVDNHGLYVKAPDGRRYLNAFVARCRSEEDARALVDVLRGVDEGRDGDPAWAPAARTEGTGEERRLEGFESRRVPAGTGEGPELALHVARWGPYVVELSTYGVPGADHTARCRAMDLAVRLLDAPPATTAAVALRYQIKAFLLARERGLEADAGAFLRDLLPTDADLRRAVRPEAAAGFLDRHRGLRLPARLGPVPRSYLHGAFRGLGPDARVRAWAETTEGLAEGNPPAGRFPAEMQSFAREAAAPGWTWLVAVITPPGASSGTTYTCFARMADRFVWIANPWEALAD